MSIIIFLIILSVLIIVHELGHFFAATSFGVRVDEFGLGYPPKAKKLFRWRGTDFTLNWLPFGGFVKIFGENPDQEEKLLPDSFQSKSHIKQAAILAAGVFCNFIFAWLLISIGLMTGIASPAGMSYPVENAHTVVTTVLPGSPAALAGLKSGDTVLSLSRNGATIPTESSAALSPDTASQFISQSLDPVTLQVQRGQERRDLLVYPKEGIVAGRPAVGIAMDLVGTAHLSPPQAVWYGLDATTELTYMTAKAIGHFALDAVRGRANLSSVTGPVGLVGMVGDVRQLGFSYLLSFTALISINLAVINLLPFPALDGGRILFVAIEAVIRRPVPAKIFNTVNTVGFGLLLLLMAIVTFRDIRALF